MPDKKESYLGEALQTSEEFDWTPYAELRLIHAMIGLKPMGTSYNFVIIMIWEKFQKAMGIDILLKTVKEKIDTWYNIKATDENFPDDDFDEIDFSLPIKDFPEIAEKTKQSGDGSQKKKNSM